MKLVDGALEREAWKPGQTGPAIGDAVPSGYGYRTYPNVPGLEFWCEYHGAPTTLTPAWLGAISRTLPPSAYGSLTFAFDIQLDGASVKAARVMEFDIRVALGGMGYNCSSQFNMTSGLWQITDVAGNWVDTQWSFPAFKPWHTHHVEIRYAFYWPLRTYSVISVLVDTSGYVVSPGLKGIAATPLAWADSVNIQIQQGLDGRVVPAGYAQVMRNIQLVWSE